MMRDEAEATVRRLEAEHPDRDTHRWVPREEADGTWSVVKVAVPAGARVGPFKAGVDAKARPGQPDDPRTSYDRNVGGPWIA